MECIFWDVIESSRILPVSYERTASKFKVKEKTKHAKKKKEKKKKEEEAKWIGSVSRNM
jgi:hypothetical protein